MRCEHFGATVCNVFVNKDCDRQRPLLAAVVTTGAKEEVR